MMSTLFSLLAGIVFAIGLSVSGMVNPDKVIGFLDIFGSVGKWDYALAFVMGGAVVFNFFSFRFLIKRKPLFDSCISLPTNKTIDKKLVAGSAMFGIGWGLMGVCPGPGIVNLATLNPTAIIFVVSLIVGVLLYRWTSKFWLKGN